MLVHIYMNNYGSMKDFLFDPLYIGTCYTPPHYATLTIQSEKYTQRLYYKCHSILNEMTEIMFIFVSLKKI